MATIKYLLLTAKENKEGKAPLQIAVYDANSTELIPARESIKPALWDQKNQGVRQKKGSIPEEVAHIDEILLNLKKEVIKIQKTLKTESDVEPSAYEIKKEWLAKLHAKKDLQKQKNSKAKEDEKLICVRVDNWVENLTHKTLTNKAVTNSMKKFKSFLGPNAEMKDLTQDKCDEYASWLFKKKKLERNSQGRHMKHLKWFIKSIKPHPFDYRDIKVLTHQKEIISLTLDELTSLENLEVPKIINSLKEFERKKGTAKNDIPSESDYQKAKDLFLLGCYTSLRVSDLKRINKNLIFIDMKKGDKEIRLTTKKNKKKLQIPILPETWKILTRYNQRSPKISEPTANKCIKGLCMVAGIESIITWTSTKGNEEKPMESKKYELVTLHVSGKTFISLADEKWGFTPSDVSAMAGKDHRTVERYYKSVNIERAKEKMRAMAVNE